MQPTTETDYKHLFTQLIQKQILILGPDITLAKVKNVPGIVVDQNGAVQSLAGDPQVLLQALINQFVELSGMIVKQTMESVLASNPGMVGLGASSVFGGTSSGTGLSVQATESHQEAASVSHGGVSQDHLGKEMSSAQISEKAAVPLAAPPGMTEVGLHSEVISTAKPESEPPIPPSSKEMQDLNKALEDLAQSPAVSEQKPQAAGV